MNTVDSFFTWPRGAMIYPAVLFPIGTILFAIVSWSTRALPRAAAALFVLANLLIPILLPLHSLRLAGGVLGLAVGLWIAQHVRRQLNPTP